MVLVGKLLNPNTGITSYIYCFNVFISQSCFVSHGLLLDAFTLVSLTNTRSKLHEQQETFSLDFDPCKQQILVLQICVFQIDLQD